MKLQTTKIKNERGNITEDTREIKRIMRILSEILC